MDQSKFQEAQHAYDAGDYRTAAKAFLASAGRGSVGNGAAYHMAGNALMRLRRHADAITVYGHALRDETYLRRGAVFANLGAAYFSAGELTEAVSAYESALEDPGYETPYRAWQGIASSNMERGRVEDAAGAYRKAALDQVNPDPGKALVNLGLCFMALGRPSDAAEAYQAALGFENYAGRGKALANLGQAFAAQGNHAEAVKAFEKATQLYGHKLSAAAAESYETAVAETREHETVEGWVTGELPYAEITAAVGDDTATVPADQPFDGQTSGWDAASLEALGTEELLGEGSSPAADLPPHHDDAAAAAAAALGFGDDDAVNDFFTRSEEEMKVQDREVRRAQRSTRPRGVKQLVIGVVGVLLVVAAALGAAYFLGFGWPTQRATVNGMMVAYQQGESVDEYWVAVPDADVDREMAKIPPVEEYSIDSVDRDKDASTVEMTVMPKKGAAVEYTVTLGREGVGWRVTGVDNKWSSTDGQ